MGIWFLLGFAGEDARPPAPALRRAAAPGGRGRRHEFPGRRRAAAAAASARVPLGRQLRAQFGYLAPNVPREIGLGLLLGLGAWVAVLLALMVVAGAVWAVYGENAVPKAPPAMIHSSPRCRS